MSDESDQPPQRIRPLNWNNDIAAIEKDHILRSNLEDVITVDVAGLDPSDAQQDTEWVEAAEVQKNSLNVLIVLWSAGTLLVSFFVAIGWWLLAKEASLPASPSLISTTSSDLHSHLNLEVPEVTLYDLPPSTVARNFALSNSAQERLKWARNPEQIINRLAHYPAQARDTPATKVEYLSQITSSRLIYETFIAEFDDGSRRLLCVLGTPYGPRVDWDAYARYGTATWEDLLAGNVSQATVRVFPEVSNYYVRHFQDRKKWQSLALSSPDLEIPLYGYLEQGSEVFHEVTEALASGALRATLELKITPEDVKYRQVEITGIHSLGWVIPDPDTSE